MKKLSQSEIKERLINILKYIDEVCVANNIPYYVAYGTLLGAIRHQGFIPWDDDIDIWIPFDKLEQFKKAINQSEEYSYTSIDEDDSYRNDFGKVLDLKTTVHEAYPIVSSKSLFVDVFPLYALGNEQKMIEKNLLRLKKKKMKMWYYNAPLKKVSGNIIKKCMKIAYILPKKIFIATHHMPKYMKKYNEYIQQLHEEYSSAAYLGYLDNPHDASFKKNMLERKWLQTIRVPFENIEVNIPTGYDEILKNLYGDYLLLPPENERINHNMEAYLKEE
ncbi:MAG: LicD family protein [Anaeroplasmataceae bacterium]|nr:LicD family protein [Anaeroplasmataceae bacterium]